MLGWKNLGLLTKIFFFLVQYKFVQYLENGICKTHDINRDLRLPSKLRSQLYKQTRRKTQLTTQISKNK